MARRARGTQPRDRGATLLEMAVSVTVLASVGGGVFAVMAESTGMFTDTLTATQMRDRTLTGFEGLRALVEQSGDAHLQVDTQGTTGDVLELQVPVAASAGTITWGAVERAAAGEGTQGGVVTWPGYDFRVSLQPEAGGTFALVREIVSSSGAVVGRAVVLARGVDGADPVLGKGFALELEENFLEATLRFRMADGEVAMTRTQTAVFRIREE